MIVDIAWNEMRIEARRALMGEGGTWDLSGDGAEGDGWPRAADGGTGTASACCLSQDNRLQGVSRCLDSVVR
jgi:hypothetical protein